MRSFDVIVVGQGYAGLKAAKLAAERGLRTATVESMFPGGLVMSINDLHPAPEGEVPSGPELTGGLAMENMGNGIENISGSATALSREDDGWTVQTDSGPCSAANIIIATGARLRKLGVHGEQELAGRGVSECADCDGPLFQGKEAVIVGGGDSAFQEAIALTIYVSKVTVVMRGDNPRAKAELVSAVAENPKIEVLSGTTVTAILGDGGAGVTGVSLQGPDGETTLPCSVVFVFVGLKPDTDFLADALDRDATGAIVTSDLQTSQSGIWAIGAARSGFGGLLSDASADAEAVVAAL